MFLVMGVVGFRRFGLNQPCSFLDPRLKKTTGGEFRVYRASIGSYHSNYPPENVLGWSDHAQIPIPMLGP